jgi:hypothetical protein
VRILIFFVLGINQTLRGGCLFLFERFFSLPPHGFISWICGASYHVCMHAYIHRERVSFLFFCDRAWEIGKLYGSGDIFA